MAEPVQGRLPMRHVRELILAIFALWLVVQNLVLLSFVPWAELGTVTLVVNALLKAAFLMMAPLWLLALAMLAGWVIAVAGVREGSSARENREMGVRHG